jgi:hypothetical protein
MFRAALCYVPAARSVDNIFMPRSTNKKSGREPAF